MSAPREDVPFVLPSPDRIQKSGLLLNRAQGLTLGQLIGDALGAQGEFATAVQIAKRFPDGVQTIRDGGRSTRLIEVSIRWSAGKGGYGAWL
ncbi:MAG: ADP-ribosylglycohydrolase family protein [Myxococcota bacterium]